MTRATEPTGPEGGRSRGRALRIGGLAVVVVVAVVLARARAAGAAPPVQAPAASTTEVVLRIVAVAVMVAAMVLLLWGRRMRRARAAAGRRVGKEPAGRLNRRVLIACLIGLLFGLAVQVLGNAAADERREVERPPPPAQSQQTRTSPDERDRAARGAEEESGTGDEIVLILAVLTLGVLIFVLVRRDTEVVDDEPQDDEEAVARAVRAGREAVADRTITDPREAIIACFAAMEAALADRGGPVTPQDADTPGEVLRRGIEAASLPAGAAATLLRLFREARYSTHPMHERDRADADAALGELLAGLRVAPSRVPGGEPAGDPR